MVSGPVPLKGKGASIVWRCLSVSGFNVELVTIPEPERDNREILTELSL